MTFIENQFNVIHNEVSILNIGQEEHEVLIKELVKESKFLAVLIFP